MENDKRNQAKAELIGAAVECISQFGLSGATVRRIAQQAKVNPAAISYYFGGRDALIQAALMVTLDNAFDIHEFEFDADTDPRDILKTYLNHWSHGIIQYPGITNTHLDAVRNHHANSRLVIDGLNGFIDGIYEIMVAHGFADSKTNRAKVRAVFGAFISSAMFPEIFMSGPDMDAYLDFLVGLI